MYLETMDTVVMSDLHGEVDKFRQARQFYGKNVRYIPDGDSINGDQPRALLDELMEVGAIATVGNHEWVTMASAFEADDFLRTQYAARWRHNDPRFKTYERHMVRDYLPHPEGDNAAVACQLAEAMDAAGHLDFIKRAPLYIETADFIIVHAGLDETPWPQQRAYLDDVQQQLAARNFGEAPDQVFDDVNKAAGKQAYDFSMREEAFTATDKIVLTGHSHMNANAEERVTAGGRRVRLGSKLALGMPLYVWQSWDQKVVAF